MKTPILITTHASGPSTSTANWHPLVGGHTTNAWQSSVASARHPIAVAGTFSRLHFKIPTAPGSGKSWTLEFLKNNSADASFKVVISDTATEASILTNPVTVAAGDDVCLKITPSGTPTTFASGQISLVFEATASGEGLIFGCNRAGMSSNTVANYLNPGVFYHSTTQLDGCSIVATAGTIDKLYLMPSATVSTGSWELEFFNSTDSGGAFSAKGVKGTLNNGTGTTVVSDTTNSFTVAQNDLLQLRANPTSTPTAVAVRWSARWRPTTDGESLLFAKMDSAVDNTLDRYFGLSAINTSTQSATEANCQNLAPVDFTAKKLAVWMETAPGTLPNSRATTLRINGSSKTLTATISGTGTPPLANDNSNTEAVVTGDLVAWLSHPNDTPTAAGQMLFGVVAFIDPSGGGGPTVHLIYRKI